VVVIGEAQVIFGRTLLAARPIPRALAEGWGEAEQNLATLFVGNTHFISPTGSLFSRAIAGFLADARNSLRSSDERRVG
jgi:hypothetical protein